MPGEIAVSVWPTAQQTARSQRAGRYVPVSASHPGKMLPAIAKAAVLSYSSPGDIVLDPMCGIGTTLVEAVHLGRDAIGVEYEPEWVAIAEENVALAVSQGATGEGEVVCGDARHLTGLVDSALRGLVALVVTSPPYGPSVHGQVRAGRGRVAKSDFRYSRDPANLAHRPLEELLEAFTAILRACRELLRPGGFVAVTARPWRRAGALVDLPGLVATCGAEAGLVPYERNVALLAGLREDQLVRRTSFFQQDRVGKARAGGLPLLAIAHEDLIVLRKGES
jgi:modification methylase